MVLAVITLIIIIGALGYTLYKKRCFGSRASLQRMRSIVNPAYGQLNEEMGSVSAQQYIYPSTAK